MPMTFFFQVPKIHCDGCATSIQEALSGLNGVESVQVDVERKKVKVVGEVEREALSTALIRAGFPPQ